MRRLLLLLAMALLPGPTLGQSLISSKPCKMDGSDCFAVAYSSLTGISASRLLGRGSAGGTGAAQEITLGSGLSMSGTTLSASGGYPVYTKTSGLTGTVQFCEILTPDPGAYGGEIEWVAIVSNGTDFAMATGVYRWAVTVVAGSSSTGGGTVGSTATATSSGGTSIGVTLLQVGDAANGKHTIVATFTGWSATTRSFTWRMRSPMVLTVNPL